MERVWGGKIFYRQNSREAILLNRVFKNRKGFPAHVYFGHSLLDSRQTSVIIDYQNNQDIVAYRPRVDWLVNSEGLAIRDEIREVNEGLYLGRAYGKGKFLLNFVLKFAGAQN